MIVIVLRPQSQSTLERLIAIVIAVFEWENTHAVNVKKKKSKPSEVIQ
jgi:hypothetical protein